jgi:Sulfatase
MGRPLSYWLLGRPRSCCRRQSMHNVGRRLKHLGAAALATAWLALTLSPPSFAQQPASKPNILVIMADDIGYWNISAYNRGMMGYRTPNIDRIANEGAIFTDYYGQQSCTAGRAAFITGQSPMRTGLLKVGLSRSERRVVGEGPNTRRFAQTPRLCDRAIRQESSRRPQ